MRSAVWSAFVPAGGFASQAIDVCVGVWMAELRLFPCLNFFDAVSPFLTGQRRGGRDALGWPAPTLSRICSEGPRE